MARSVRGSLGGEELFFARESPAIARQASVPTDNPVARHDNRNRVGCARSGHRANGLRTSEGAGDLGVGARRSAWNALQLLPDAALKRRCCEVQREFHLRGLALDALNNFTDPALHLASSRRDFRTRIFFSQLRDEFV